MGTYGQPAYDFLKQLSFPRVSGSTEEQRAGELIAKRVREIGFLPVFEPFEYISERPVETEFALMAPETVCYSVTGCINAGNTPPEGREAEFCYLRNIDEIALKQAKAKFVLLNERPGEKDYKRLVDAGIAGMLFMNGTSRDTYENSDLDTMRFRDCYIRHGKMPAFAMRMIDVLDLLHRNPQRVRFKLRTETVKVTSRNIVVEVPGSDLAEETIAVGAHYDSTEFSCGAWDNGAGVVQVLGLLEHLAAHPPRRTVKIIFFGSEEVGLMGSRAYLETHSELKDSLLAMVNADVGGSYLGKEMIVVTGTQTAEDYVRSIMYDTGHSARLSCGVMSSDSIVFSDHGIPSISLGQFPPQGGGYMHTRYDNMDMISRDVLDTEVCFMIALVERLAGAEVFPIPRVIPKDLRQNIVDYFGTGLSQTETVTEFPEEPERNKPLF